MASHPHFDLPGVGKVHLPGVFGDFQQTVLDRIKMRREKGNPQTLEMARFFEYLLEQVDAREYERVRSDLEEVHQAKAEEEAHGD